MDVPVDEDAAVGDLTTETRYSDPALGLLSSTVVDPSGMRLVNEATYEKPGEGLLRQIIRFFEQTTEGVVTALRLIVANPRQGLLMATVWLLLAGPFLASRRRRALLAVTGEIA